MDRISIQVGQRLIKLVDPRRKSSLSSRISPLRRKFARQYGVVLPLIRLKDNVSLDANAYEIRLHNHVVATGRLEPDMYLAMDSGEVHKPVKGRAAVEPVFNLPALWVEEDQKAEAELRGYTVVDPESVLVTHLSEVLRKHAYELLSRDDVQILVDRLRDKQPALINEVVGEAVSTGLLQRVLQNLLKDGVPIRDLAQIIETLGDHAAQTKDPAALTEMARKALVRTITEQNADASGKIIAVSMDPALEYELRTAFAGADGKSAGILPERAVELTRAIQNCWQNAVAGGHDKAVLLCDSKVRPHLAALMARQAPQLAVLAYDEVTIGTRIESVGTISLRPMENAEAGDGRSGVPARAAVQQA